MKLDNKLMTNPSKFAGVLPVIKPAGPTSHDIVQIARRALREKQIGHTGTLDPAATGVLVLCIGPYTKLVPYLTESDKTYGGYIGLGIETDTDDSEGVPTLIGDPSTTTLDRIRAQAARFEGDIEQIPPKYAAIKVAGKKLYEYARANQEVVVPPRPVTVYSFDIHSVEDQPAPKAVLDRASGTPIEQRAREHSGTIKAARFEARVSTGTYVRALARDLGRELGCGGYLASLSRSSVGQFQHAQAMPIEVLQSAPERACEFVARGAAAIDSHRYPVLTIIQGYVERLLKGQPLHEKMMENAEEASRVSSGTVVAVADTKGRLLAMMQAERFEQQMQANVYGTRFMVHFRPVRTFPGGLI